MREPFFNEAQWRFIFQVWCRGYTLTEISRWLGVAIITIRRNFERYGLYRDKPPIRTFTPQLLALGGDSDV